jgi:shikimate kinase
MTEKSIVYIIGFMGSGKSTAGRKLAASLGWSFVDLDRIIEETAGKTIPQIFSQEGEDQFRKIEAEVLQNLGQHKETVVSTGGGTPCHGDNMDYMLKTGLTVYLKMTPDQLAKRLLGSSGERPLLKNVPDDRLFEFIEEKLAYREKWYSKANITVDGMCLNIDLIRSIINSRSGN